MGFATGKDSKVAPTPEMLRAYYRIVAVLTGDLTSGVWGPFANRSADDVSLMSDFLTSVGGTAQPRGVLVNGDGFADLLVAAPFADAAGRNSGEIHVVFGGANFDTLYAMCSDKVYKRKTKAKGVMSAQPPIKPPTPRL